MSDFRDTLYTVTKDGKRKWVYPVFSPGLFFKMRSVVIYTLLALLLMMPWLPIAGSQAILLDIPHRRFVFFGKVFWATDTRFLFLILAMAGLSLFFFTSLLGRIWCGWACPQTVFLEFVFRPIERLIEGSPAKRQKRDHAPWTSEKIKVKSIKYIVFIVIAWFLASTFLAYFVGREPLITMMTHLPNENLGMFIATCFIMTLFLFEFGWFREQFCTLLCPYARFQSVLMDKDSLLVGYDYKRGEPRGKLKQEAPNKGDCIDCGLCVRVCPTGIDIRNGTQLECIQCASCIDACDSVMVKIGKPKGLVRYDTERGIQNGNRRFLRPRVVAYGAILALLLITFSTLLATRNESEFVILRLNKAQPYQILPDGRVSNQFKIHIGNKSFEERFYRVDLVQDPQIEIITPVSPFPVKAGSDAMMPVFININKHSEDKKTHEIELKLFDQHGLIGTQRVSILLPG